MKGVGHMQVELGHEEIVIVGFSRTLLVPLADVLPPGSVVVVEEPDIAAKRQVEMLAREHPAISRVVLWEYQRPGAAAALLRNEPGLKTARAVLPGIEYAVEFAAALAALLGVPGAGAEAGAIFRNKLRQRRTAAAGGIRNPDYAVVRSEADAVAFLTRTRARCVLKPTARQASLGVVFVTTVDEVDAAVHEARDPKETVLVPDRGIASELLIERALDGAEYSVEMLVFRGRPCFSNVTAKRVVSGRYPVELGHVVPGPLAPGLAGSLVDGTVRLAEAAGFENGILHCEWIVDEHGPALIECAARMPGDEIGTLISAAYDFPLAQAYLSILLGVAPEVPGTARFGAAIRFLVAPPGHVERVDGVPAAQAAPGVQTVKVSVAPGDEVRPVRSSWDRAGYVLTRAADADEAERYAITTADLIQVRTRPT
jgi:biotin carboxylase